MREEFEYCLVDREAGSDHVGQMIAKFVELRVSENIIASYSARHKGDDQGSDALLYFGLIPNEPVIIGYNSAGHEAACAPVLQRCAQVLNYEVTLSMNRVSSVGPSDMA